MSRRLHQLVGEAEQRGEPAGVDEHDAVALGYEAAPAVIEQAGEPLSRIDRVQQDALRRTEHPDGIDRPRLR
jgi:hypothetical protein